MYEEEKAQKKALSVSTFPWVISNNIYTGKDIYVMIWKVKMADDGDGWNYDYV